MYVEGADEWRPRLNPNFVKRARQTQARKKAEEDLRRSQEQREWAAKKIEWAKREARERDERTRLALRAEERLSSLLCGLGAPKARSAMGVADIIATVALKHGVTPAEIKGRSRKVEIVAARHEAMAETRRLRPDLSYPLIGKLFGGRDHTTVIHAVKKMGGA